MSEEIEKDDAVAALKRVKEAEEEARRIIQDAREKASPKIVQDAYEEAKKIKESRLTKARIKADEKKNDIIQQAAEEAEKIRKKAEEDTASLRKGAEKVMSEAIKKVAEKIRHYLEGETF